MPLTAEEFEQGRQAFHAVLIKRGVGIGPAYTGDNGYSISFYDQCFERGFEPTGTVNCKQALRVGATQHGLFVFLQANPNNTGNLLIPAGSTITLSLLQGDAEQGTFEDVGPTVCVKAPARGWEIAPGMRVCPFAIGDFQKPWLMTSLEFSGAITGGNVDCYLGYVAR